jgi:hypothetical protein
LELCKRIENYDLDSTEELCIKISNSIMKVSCDGYGYKVFTRRWKVLIVTKYSVDQELSRLPETEINKILKIKWIKWNYIHITTLMNVSIEQLL